MPKLITGIHHVTAIASDAQNNINFYAGILGLKFIKKTVNYDAPEIYHFYYGHESNPGIITFFPYQKLTGGRHGKGMLNSTTFSVNTQSLNYWLARLKKFGIPYKPPHERYQSELVVYFEDTDGLGLEFVFNDHDSRDGSSAGLIPQEHSIKGLYNTEIWAAGYELTAGLLTGQLQHQLISEKGNRFRFAAMDSPGHYVDILCMPDSLKGLAGSGTVHHLAFSSPTESTQNEIHSTIVASSLNPTQIVDRHYFKSFYFREPGGVLFEIATEGPGFSIDESNLPAHNILSLPPQYENRREELQTKLLEVTFNYDQYR